MSVSTINQARVEVKPPQSRGLRSMVAGGLTGAINIMIVFPTEFVKTQLQLDGGRTVYSPSHSLLCSRLKLSGTGLASRTEKLFSGSVDVVRKTVRDKGVTGLYRGVQVLLTGTIPTYAVR